MNDYKPPFTITNKMLDYVSSIMEKIGKLDNYTNFNKMPALRRNNRIRSIHSSLAIEANSLSLGQVKDVIAGRTVIGPQKEIQEVKNAYNAYEMINKVDVYSIKDLKNINLQIKEKESINEVRTLDDNIINDIKYDKYKGVIHTAYRAIDELEIKKVLESNKIDNIDEDFIDKLSNSMNTSKEEMIKKIDMFVSRYYPNDNQIHDYIGVVDYDLRNGQQLSNEARFIYANCLVEKLNGMNLDNQQKIEFYKMYLNNAKNMSFQEVLKLFNVDLTNPYNFSEEFISEFNTLSNDDTFQRGTHQL